MPGIDKNRFINIREIEDFLLCDICLTVFGDPKVTQCCQQTYCSDCIEEWIKNYSKTCPNCRKALTKRKLSQPPRLVVNLLNEQKLKCDFFENGCLEQLLYVRYKQHIKDCRYNPEAICGDCGEKNGQRGAHNCVDNLMAKHKCLQNLQPNYLTLKNNNEQLCERIANLEIELLNMKGKYDEKCVAFCELNQRFNNDANTGRQTESHTQRDAIANQLIAEHTIKRKTDYNNNEKLSQKREGNTTRINNLVLHSKDKCSYIKNAAKQHSQSVLIKRTKTSEPDLSSKTNAKKLKTNADDRDNENPNSTFPLPIDIVFDIEEDSKSDSTKKDSISNESNNDQNTTIIDLDAIFMRSNDEDLPAIDNLNNNDDRVNSNDCNDSNTVSSDKNIVNSGSLAATASDSDDDRLSENNEKVALFKERRRLSNEKLLQCIKHGKVETHLVGVYRESIFSERHRKFKCGSELEKNQLIDFPWFGPIDDEEQQEDIYDYCSQLFESTFKTDEFFDCVAYMFEVWVPEAIVKAISSVRRIELKDAELVFAKGVVSFLELEFLKQTRKGRTN